MPRFAGLAADWRTGGAARAGAARAARGGGRASSAACAKVYGGRNMVEGRRKSMYRYKKCCLAPGLGIDAGIPNGCAQRPPH